MRRVLLVLLICSSAIAQRRPIAPRPLVPIPYSIERVATAFAGERFLTVWAQHTAGGGTHISGAFSDADGRLVSPASFPIVANVQGVFPPVSLQLLGLGDGYALIWSQLRYPPSRHMVELDLDGAVTRHVAIPYDTPSSHEETYAWNGTHFIGMFMQRDETDGIVFRRDGTLVQAVQLERIHDYRTAVPSGDGFLVVTGGRGGAIAQRVDEDGASRRLAFLNAFGRNVAAADAGGGDALAVWAVGERLQAARITSGLDIGTRHDLATPGRAVPEHVTRTPNGFRVVVRSLNDDQLSMIDLAPDGAPRAISDLRVEGRSAPERVASNDRAILVAFPSAPSVRSIAVAANGNVHTELLSISPMRQSDPLAVVANGRFLVTWFDSPGDASIARAATVNVRGETTVTTTLAQGVVALAGKLAWNGSEALLVTRREKLITGTRLSANGTPYEEPFTIATPERLRTWLGPPASVIWAGDRWIVAWIDDARQQLFTAEVAATRNAGAPRRFEVPSQTSKNGVTNASLAWNGRDVLLVWENNPRSSGCCAPPQVLYATRLDERGQARDEAIVLARGVRHSEISIASGGEDFVVLHGGKTIAIRTDEYDQLSAGQPRTLSEYPGTIMGDLTWDGAEYVAALRYGIYDSHLSLFRLDRDGRPARHAPAYMHVNHADLPRAVMRPAVAADRVMGVVIAMHEGLGAAETAHVTVVREADLGPIVAPPSAPVVERRKLSMYTYTLSWEPVPDAEGYILELLSWDGVWRGNSTIPADRTSTTVTIWDPSSRVRAFNAGGFSF